MVLDAEDTTAILRHQLWHRPQCSIAGDHEALQQMIEAMFHSMRQANSAGQLLQPARQQCCMHSSFICMSLLQSRMHIADKDLATLQSDLVIRGALAPVRHGGRVYPPVHPWLTPKPVLDWLRRSQLLSSSWPWLSLLNFGTQASLQQEHSTCEGKQTTTVLQTILHSNNNQSIATMSCSNKSRRLPR